MTRTEAIKRLKDSQVEGPGGRYGSCSTEYVRGREAVMPDVLLRSDRAVCTDLCSLRGDEWLV